MNKQVMFTSKAPQPIGPYSQAILYDNLLFVSGQSPIDPETGKTNSTDVEGQTRQVLTNIRNIVEEAGCSLHDVLKVTAFLDDMNNFTAFNKVYEEFFNTSKPARSCIQAGKLPMGWKVEVEAIVGKKI